MVGALVAAVIANKSKMVYALSIGLFFLVGGVSMVFMVPAPTWFIVVDLVGAYLPMAWIGGRMVSRKK